MMRWGLVLAWAKDTKIGAKMINARRDCADERDIPLGFQVAALFCAGQRLL